MKKTRRIQITTFRRQVTVYSGEHSEDANGPLSSSAESWENIDASDRPRFDLGEICSATLDITRVDTVGFPGKALGESNGNSIAAEKFGFKLRRLYWKLRSSALSISKLKRISTRSARGK